MKKMLFAAAVGVAFVTSAQASYVFTGSSVTENFDGLAVGTSATAATAITPNPFSATVGVQAVVTGTGFDATKVSGTGTTALPFLADAGNGNGGGVYSYGATNVAERALGTLASGTNVAAFGVEIVNNSGAAITSVTVSYNSEAWRSSTSTTNVLQAQYGTGAAGSTSYLTAATGFTDVDTLDVTGPAFGATNGALDGNTVTLPLTATISFASGPIPAGQSFYLRLTDTNDTGNDAGLAIDTFNFSAVTGVAPEPTTLAAIAGASILSLRRRRA